MMRLKKKFYVLGLALSDEFYGLSSPGVSLLHLRQPCGTLVARLLVSEDPSHVSPEGQVGHMRKVYRQRNCPGWQHTSDSANAVLREYYACCEAAGGLALLAD